MFSHFSLHRLLLKALREQGLRHPTPVQAEAVPAALEGADLQVTAETGSGKTLAYLLPALNRLLSGPGRGGIRLLILSPTRELAQQVFDVCSALVGHTRLTAGLICGGRDIEAQQQLLADETPIIIATGGRLIELMESGSVDLSNLEMLVLDEADRMLEMGFSADVARIAEAAADERQTLLFSATMNNPWLKNLTAKLLRQPQVLNVSGGRAAHSFVTEQVILADNDAHKQKQLLWLLRNEQYGKAVVFANSRAAAERIGVLLQQAKLRCVTLHGEISAGQRTRAMAKMIDDDIEILVATDLAARGLDIDNVGLVINYDMPRRGDDYVHRIGRTGRNQTQGLAITLVEPAEWNLKASVERYLKHRFEPRLIESLKGEFKGPAKLRASGKTVGNKKKPKDKKAAKLKGKVKKRKRDKVKTGKRGPNREQSTTQ